MRHKAVVMLISFLVTLPQGIFVGYFQFTIPTLLGQGLSVTQYTTLVSTLDVIDIVLNPVMLFIVIYVVGRNLNLSSTYLGVAAFLFLGALLGNLLGRAAVYYTSPLDPKDATMLLGIAAQSAESAVPVVFT